MLLTIIMVFTPMSLALFVVCRKRKDRVYPIDLYTVDLTEPEMKNCDQLRETETN